jgi:hypothetical protein
MYPEFLQSALVNAHIDDLRRDAAGIRRRSVKKRNSRRSERRAARRPSGSIRVPVPRFAH